MSHALSFTHPTLVGRGGSGVVALWFVQIALAAMFLLAGGSKLLGAPAMVTLFKTIAVGQWFRYATGIIEVGSAIALLVPSLAAFGAVALVPTMIGAVATELFIVGDSAIPAAVLLLGAIGVVWARREQLLGIVVR
jgi:putative oxidoreductase